MRKLLTILVMVVALSASLSVMGGRAAAVNISPNCGAGSANGQPGVCQDISTGQSESTSQNPIIKILKGAINIISYAVGVAAVIVLIISGLRLITSGGDTSKQATARSGVIYSIIGIAVVILAQVIVIFVLSRIK